jgi:hypothetical protein
VSNQNKSSTICKKYFGPIDAPGKRRFLSLWFSGDGVDLPLIGGLARGGVSAGEERSHYGRFGSEPVIHQREPPLAGTR